MLISAYNKVIQLYAHTHTYMFIYFLIESFILLNIFILNWNIVD